MATTIIDDSVEELLKIICRYRNLQLTIFFITFHGIYLFTHIPEYMVILEATGTADQRKRQADSKK